MWFGDAPSHDPDVGATLGSTITALQGAQIKVIAISTGADRLDLFGQVSAIATATGGQLRSGVDDSAVTAAILSGLQNLPVTITRQVTCDAGLTVVLTPTGPETFTSGGTGAYSEVITVSPGNPGGVTLHCTVRFLLNGILETGFTETINVTVPGADVAIVKTGPALVTEGQTYSYTLAVTNNGPATATGVTVSDPLPANTTFVSASAGCTLAAGTVTCNVGTLASGAGASFTVTVKAGGAGTTIVNKATVSANQSDPVPGNNSSTFTSTLNHNPVCTAVKANPAALWPPNHTLRSITLSGATDPDGNPVTFTVTGVTQDEPTNGLGDGDVAPDAVIGSGPNLQVRAERSGLGDGRVYRIAFTVSDGRGGSCTGVAKVGVPHDQSPPCIPGGRLPQRLQQPRLTSRSAAEPSGGRRSGGPRTRFRRRHPAAWSMSTGWPTRTALGVVVHGGRRPWPRAARGRSRHRRSRRRRRWPAGRPRHRSTAAADGLEALAHQRQTPVRARCHRR